MSSLKYAALYEDVAHREFVRCVLPQLALRIDSEIEVGEVKFFRIEANNKSEVDKFCNSASKVAFVEYQADFFVVCRDIDSHDPKVFTQKQEELSAKLHHSGVNKTVLCLPVQCIEHWLLYLKRRSENPDTTKKEHLENIPRREAKEHVYNRVKPKKEHCTAVVNEHCAVVDIAWLESRSASFLAFATNVRTVLEHLTGRAA